MNKTVNIQNEANIKAEGKLNSRHCKPVICLETGEVFTSVRDAAEAIGCHHTNLSQHLTGKLRNIKGKHFCYISRVNESLDAIVTRLRETSAMEDDARKWREFQAEQEAKRKAEEKRLEMERKAKEQHAAAVAKAEEKLARCKTICERIEAQLHKAEENYLMVEAELKSLLEKEQAA